MTTLVIDNYDSFTWNLVQLVGALGERPHVFRNDAIDIDGIRALAPSRIILSPGPGHPEDPARVGVCRAIITELGRDVPILGVCLGHQLIAHAYGGRVIRASEVMHGKTSLVHHEGDTILADLPRPFEAMRYHSLVVDRAAVPASLHVTAWCKDGTVMAVRHRQHPVYGVQFHPESIGTACGRALVAAFLGVRRTRMIGMETSTLLRVGLVVTAASLAACGGAAPGAQSPAKAFEAPGPEATSVEEAQQQIAAAKAELAGGGGAAKSPYSAPPAPPGVAPGADSARPSSEPKKPSVSESTDASKNSGDDRCGNPCRALASMRRAVGALCRMTGTEDARCTDAKRTLAESEGRVSPCSC